METQAFFVGGGPGETIMTSSAAAALALAFLLIFLVPRKYVVVPLLVAMLIVPRDDVFVLGGVHLPPTRVLCAFGWLRLLSLRASSKEPFLLGGLNSIDRAVLVSQVAMAVSVTLLWMSTTALTNQLGQMWTTLGVYFLLRSLIRDNEDILRTVKILALVALLNGMEMVYEQVRNQNLFGVFLGGVSTVPQIREGKIRSQGAFGHAILAGTYGATTLPLTLLLWRCSKAKLLGGVGVLATLLMVYTSASSTPTMAITCGLLAICLWPLRKVMRLMRWGIVLALVGAQLVMKAPVWMLIAHMDVIGGSSGYHRALLVDTFFKHFLDWWLIGTHDIFNWGFEMWDVSNTYVSVGETGGLIAFTFFIATISRSFGCLGRVRKSVEGDRKQEWFMWFLCASLFAHAIGFFGITYWDQTSVAWYTLLALISAAIFVGVPEATEKSESASPPPQSSRVFSVDQGSGIDWRSVAGLEPMERLSRRAFDP